MRQAAGKFSEQGGVLLFSRFGRWCMMFSCWFLPIYAGVQSVPDQQ
jgi:hypothetical protein